MTCAWPVSASRARTIRPSSRGRVRAISDRRFAGCNATSERVDKQPTPVEDHQLANVRRDPEPIALAMPRELTPSARRDRRRRSIDTDGSPPSILAMRD